jgi:hypothetical protein
MRARVLTREVVADDSDARVGAEVRPRLPVVLVEGVLDGGLCARDVSRVPLTAQCASEHARWGTS